MKAIIQTPAVIQALAAEKRVGLQQQIREQKITELLINKIKVDAAQKQLCTMNPKARIKLTVLITGMETELLGHCSSIYNHAPANHKLKYRHSTNRVFNAFAAGGMIAAINNFNTLCKTIDSQDIDVWEYKALGSMFIQVEEAIEKYTRACEYADIPPSQRDKPELKDIRCLKNILVSDDFQDRMEKRMMSYVIAVEHDPNTLNKIRSGEHRNAVN